MDSYQIEVRQSRIQELEEMRTDASKMGLLGASFLVFGVGFWLGIWPAVAMLGAILILAARDIASDRFRIAQKWDL